MNGTWIDSRRLNGRSVAESALTQWPGELRVLDILGHRIRLRDTGGSGPVVALAADCPNVIEHHGATVDRLRAHYRVLCLEPPGFGYSRPAKGFRFTLGEYREWLRSVLDRLEIDRITLAFGCVNAMIALAFANRWPERVEALVLSQFPAFEEFVRWSDRVDMRIAGLSLIKTPILGQTLTTLAPRFIARQWYKTAFTPELRHWYSDIGLDALDHGAAFCLASINQGLAGATAAELGPVKCPTAVLWGERDRTHRRTDKESAQIHANSVELCRLADCGHAPDIEDPETVREMVDKMRALA